MDVFHFSLLVSHSQPLAALGLISVSEPHSSRSSTFETRDDIFTLNPNLPPGGEFLWSLGRTFVDLCLVSINISGSSAPDVSCLPRLFPASVLAPGFPWSLCEHSPHSPPNPAPHSCAFLPPGVYCGLTVCCLQATLRATDPCCPVTNKYRIESKLLETSVSIRRAHCVCLTEKNQGSNVCFPNLLFLVIRFYYMLSGHWL